ncbi:MAG: 2-C-methyl-D-erythritol 4-phosphate cytidylyltransferase [Steroidobacteraceae bacterium]
MTSALSARRVFAVVPAAGRGARFDPTAKGAPKQYAPLLDASVIEWSLRALLQEPRVEKIVVAVAADDLRWPALAAAIGAKSAAAGAASKLLSAVGGASRQESVLSGLRALRREARPDDWVMVHDAARPCLDGADVRALIEALDRGAAGAVLAAPIVDTVKRESGGLVSETVDRAGLWRALTPQVFALAALEQALADAVRRGITVTDEAQAMELLGGRPQLVQGSPFNIKVTRAEDLAVASLILRAMREQTQ